MKEILSVRFSRSAKTYEKWAVPQKKTARILVETVSPEGLVLDLGCGTGFVSSFLREGCTPVGLDISPHMVEAYKRRFPLGIIGDAESLPFKDKSFDYVLSNFSLHWTALEKSFEEALRVARKGVGISLPVEGSLQGLDFPFPSEDEIFPLVEGLSVKSFSLTVEIPFKGWDLLRFFHYTGTSFNPNRDPIFRRDRLASLFESLERPSFRVLFLYVRLS